MNQKSSMRGPHSETCKALLKICDLHKNIARKLILAGPEPKETEQKQKLCDFVEKQRDKPLKAEPLTSTSSTSPLNSSNTNTEDSSKEADEKSVIRRRKQESHQDAGPAASNTTTGQSSVNSAEALGHRDSLPIVPQLYASVEVQMSAVPEQQVGQTPQPPAPIPPSLPPLDVEATPQSPAPIPPPLPPLDVVEPPIERTAVQATTSALRQT